MYMFWPAPATPRSAVPQTRSFGLLSAAALATKASSVVGRLQPLRVVEILAIDLDGDLAVIGHAVELAVDAVGAAPGRDDVVELEPGRIRQRCVIQIGIERLDPFVRGIERVIHGIGGMRGVGASLRGQVDDAFWRICAGGIFSKRTSIPVSASNCGASVIRLSK